MELLDVFHEEGLSYRELDVLGLLEHEGGREGRHTKASSL